MLKTANFEREGGFQRNRFLRADPYGAGQFLLSSVMIAPVENHADSVAISAGWSSFRMMEPQTFTGKIGSEKERRFTTSDVESFGRKGDQVLVQLKPSPFGGSGRAITMDGKIKGPVVTVSREEAHRLCTALGKVSAFDP